eukprot:363712-Chlamydomonas_euryale.AAC.16
MGGAHAVLMLWACMSCSICHEVRNVIHRCGTSNLRSTDLSHQAVAAAAAPAATKVCVRPRGCSVGIAGTSKHRHLEQGTGTFRKRWRTAQQHNGKKSESKFPSRDRAFVAPRLRRSTPDDCPHARVCGFPLPPLFSNDSLGHCRSSP